MDICQTPCSADQVTIVIRCCTSGCTSIPQEGEEKGSRMSRKALSKIYDGESFEDFCHVILFPFAE